MLGRGDLVRTDVSEELSASFIRVTGIGELGTTLSVTSKKYLVFLCSVCRLLVTASVPSSTILVTLVKEALSSSETSVLTRATRRNIPEDTILHSHCRENLKSYIALVGFNLSGDGNIMISELRCFCKTGTMGKCEKSSQNYLVLSLKIDCKPNLLKVSLTYLVIFNPSSHCYFS
jgi:hypothetical protein